MARGEFGLEPDPRLVAPAIGPDELESVRARSGGDILIELISRSASRFKLADLIDFNRGFASTAPAILVPAQVRLINEATETPLPGLFRLDTEITPPFTKAVFTLRRLTRARTPEETRAEAVAGALDKVQGVLDSGEADALDFLLETMLEEAEQALADLRRVAEIHRDSVQNAVDIVQTKRIDFLENPVETGIEGTFLGFVVAEIATEVLPSIVGLVFETVAKAAFSLIGAATYHQSKLDLTAFVAGRRQSLRGNIMLLQAAKGLRFPEGAVLIKEKNRLLNRLKQEIAQQEKDIANAELEGRLLFKAILPDAAARAKEIRARVAAPSKGILVDPLPNAGNVAKAALSKKITDAFKIQSGAQTDPRLKSSAIPVDVAMKLEVQTYFDPWVDAAETAVAFLRSSLATFRRFGTLPDSAVTEISVLAASAVDLQAATEAMRALIGDSAAARADLTGYYELLLWLTLYRPRLSHVPELRRTRIETDIDGNIKGPIKQLPVGDKATMNLLRYLAQRFFGKGKIVGEGAEAELQIDNPELLGVYIQLERLCADIFQPEQGQGGRGDLLATALKDIRFSLIKYE